MVYFDHVTTAEKAYPIIFNSVFNVLTTYAGSQTGITSCAGNSNNDKVVAFASYGNGEFYIQYVAFGV